MYEKVIKVKGSKPGPISVIIAGIHGNEVCGLKALNKILPSLTIEAGLLYIVYGNISAIKKNKRFIEFNLNRLFKDEKLLSALEKKSAESKRARIIKKYLDKADALLDIHASTSKNSHPFIICEKNAKDIFPYLPFDLVVSGFDKIEPGGTDYYMNKKGKIGICVECGYLGDDASADTAVKSIFSFLKARGHIRGEIKKQKQKYINIYDLYIAKSAKFNLTKDYADFESISKGEIIARDNGVAVKAKRKSVILFPTNCRKPGEEAYLLGEIRKNLI